MLLQSQHLETLPILERRIRELAEENKKLHAEATELANEAKVSFITRREDLLNGTHDSFIF